MESEHPDWNAPEYTVEQQIRDAEAYVERNPRKSYRLLLEALSEASEKTEDALLSRLIWPSKVNNAVFAATVRNTLYAYIHECHERGALDIER